MDSVMPKFNVLCVRSIVLASLLKGCYTTPPIYLEAPDIQQDSFAILDLSFNSSSPFSLVSVEIIQQKHDGAWNVIYEAHDYWEDHYYKEVHHNRFKLNPGKYKISFVGKPGKYKVYDGRCANNHIAGVIDIKPGKTYLAMGKRGID